ncbi:MAG: hypothetical protein ACE5R6_19445 [Candidatus Heimdallarchaeota archaeon]
MKKPKKGDNHTREEEKNLTLAILLNEESILVPDKDYNSVDVIREWRETIRWKP